MSIKKLNLLTKIYLSTKPEATAKEFARYLKMFETTERFYKQN